RLAYLDVGLAFNGTPFAKLYTSAKFLETNVDYLPINLSDMCRLAVVYKSGGFYTDMDTLALRSVLNLTNFIALQVDEIKSFNNAVFHFKRGHSMLQLIMQFVTEDYNGIIYSWNGPVAITKAVERSGCDATPRNAMGQPASDEPRHFSLETSVKIVNEHDEQIELCDWLALKTSYFYPVYWDHALPFLFLATMRSNNITIHE
ncbi:lactosylceramide 4-alpha-galactosyltransferase-like, partial [Hyalella azteca]|uniref:Lactosylceramide 4-alpha-galactosyltransferase-like n=1 Tax=Hyalella azteca TaxID=294128 RepID=A0A8B7NNX0_HYAAZ